MNSARPHATPHGAGPDWRHRLLQYARLARLHRPIGILLLLWPMLWALWIAAEGVPRLDVLVIFVLFEPMGLYGRWLKVRTWFQLFPFYRKGMFKRQKSFTKSDRLK